MLMPRLLSQCCEAELVWGFEKAMVNPPVPLGYGAQCMKCRKWCAGIPIADSERVCIEGLPETYQNPDLLAH